MKALVYTQPREVTYRDEPDPQPAAGECVVRIDAVGICGSDMHGYLGHDARRVPPLILGHEAAGEVVSGGRRRRVVLNPLITCGTCRACTTGHSNLCPGRRLIGMNRPGAFAQFIAMPESNLIDVPDGMDATHAALTEPAATAWHGVHLAARVLSRPLAESAALVIGGGSVGLLAALVLGTMGCRDLRLAETNALRLDGARSAGIAAFDPAAEDGPDEGSVDLVIDAVGGARTRAAAMAAIAPGGVIVHIGLMDTDGGLDVRKMTLSEITVMGSYTYTAVDLRAAMAALHGGALGALDWVERRALADGAGAFSDLDGGRTGAAKVVLVP